MPDTVEDVLDNVFRDVQIAGLLARERKLTPDHAEGIAARVRAAAFMTEPSDRSLLDKTAQKLEAVSRRIKAAAVAPRTKTHAAPRKVALEPSDRELVARWDKISMNGGWEIGQAPRTIENRTA